MLDVRLLFNSFRGSRISGGFSLRKSMKLPWKDDGDFELSLPEDSYNDHRVIDLRAWHKVVLLHYGLFGQRNPRDLIYFMDLLDISSFGYK